MGLIVAFWVVTTLIAAVGQGWLLPAIRRTPPGPEAKRQALALHTLLAGGWLAPVVFHPEAFPVALVSRIALFDLALNATQHEPWFSVGKTAFTDRALNWLAPRLQVSPSLLSALLRVLALGGGGWLGWHLWSK